MKLISLKKTSVAIMLSMCGTTAVMASNTITFNGQVLEEGCTISVDGGAADATVELGSTAAADLATAGELGAPKQFAIDLAECPTSTTADIVFSGQIDADGNPAHFKNIESGATAATNVGVLLKQGNSSGIEVQNDADNDPIDLSSGEATQNYTAQMVATADDVTAGDVQTVLTYNIRYN